MRLGIFGGTFDPPHVGHLLAASDAFEHLALDRLLFVPAAIQPLKANRATAPGVHRLEMVRLTTGTDTRFGVDPVELNREGLSYSVDTLREFARQYPSAELFFLVGADVLSSFAQWRDPQIVLELATLAIMTRRAKNDDQLLDDRLLKWQRRSSTLDAELARRTTRVATRRFDVSSTEIRERVREGKSIHGFVTDAVAEYIGSHGLYR